MNRFFNSAAAAILVPALSLIVLAACDGGSSGGGAGSPGVGLASLGSSGGGSSGLVSETCKSSDPNHICLGTKWVTYTDPTGAPVLTQQQALTNLATMNQLWAQCDIGFQIEQYQQVDPTQFGLDFGAQSENELDQIRSAFNDNQTLLSVTTGAWNDTVNAWTALPGSGPYGAILEATIVDYGAGIIYAHEFGHYLGLQHVPDTSDLMDAIIYTNSDTITSDECATARQTAQQMWSGMIR